VTRDRRLTGRRPGRRSPVLARAVRRGLLAAGVTACAAVAGGCDGSTATGTRRFGHGELTIYTSLPYTGPSRLGGRATLEGEQMALAAVHGHIGRFAISLRSLNDATVHSDGWDPGQTNANADVAADDQRTIGYLGDLNSGASAVSLPILNRARIPQISPLSTAVGLTEGGDEAQPGEPQKYYPTMIRTFARVVPNDRIQSTVQVAIQRQAGCRKVFVLYDDQDDGRDAADSFQVAAKRADLDVLGYIQYDSSAKNYLSLGAKLAKIAPDCVLISALPQDNAAAVTDAVARALPDARLFATASLAESAYADPSLGGVARFVDPRLTITAPTLSTAQLPAAGRAFQHAFERRYGSWQPDAIYGQAAMALMLHAISVASADGTQPLTRASVARAVFATRDLPSVLGTYSIDKKGDTSLRRYGVYAVRGGRLVFQRSLRG
jgi:branched-chain amino acid transport system substrate-binding protein